MLPLGVKIGLNCWRFKQGGVKRLVWDVINELLTLLPLDDVVELIGIKVYWGLLFLRTTLLYSVIIITFFRECIVIIIRKSWRRYIVWSCISFAIFGCSISLADLHLDHHIINLIHYALLQLILETIWLNWLRPLRLRIILILLIFLLHDFHGGLPSGKAAAHYFPEGPRVIGNLSLKSLHKIRLINVLRLLLQIHCLILQGALHAELEFLAADVKELIEDWALHL